MRSNHHHFFGYAAPEMCDMEDPYKSLFWIVVISIFQASSNNMLVLTIYYTTLTVIKDVEAKDVQ